MRITSSILEESVNRLNKKLGLEPPYAMQDNGSFKYNVNSFILNNMKPGNTRLFKLAQISNEAGGERDISEWMSNKEMLAYLNGMHDMLMLQKELQ